MNPSTFSLRRQVIEDADREERRIEDRRNRRKARALLRRSIDPFTAIPEREFVKSFRLYKVAVRDLATDVIPLLPEERRCDSIHPIIKILVALSFYATGSYQTLVGHSALHNVSQTSVCRAIRQVTVALNHPSIYKKYVKWPLELSARNSIKARFYRKFKMPAVVGVVDGTHVAILCPTISEERYYNRKGYHSLNVMIICDADLNILCVDASYPGSTHDATVWRSHPLCHHLQDLNNEGEQVFLLGDSGYPLRQSLVTPILNTTEGTPEHHFYMAHVKARNTVERCIGLLKARFRCLLAARALHYKPTRAAQIVNACVVLHNLANQRRTPVEPLTPEEVEAEYQRQIHDLRPESDADAVTNNANDRPSRRVNSDLLAGRALQRMLVQKLWRERLTH